MTRPLSIPDWLALGLVAGLAGTAAMSVGQALEMRASGRKPSRTPARAVEKLGDVDLEDGGDEERASTAIHWAYGTALGAALPALKPVPEPWRTTAFFALAWGGGAALLSALKLARPPHRQSTTALATDLGHHLVYAAAAGAAFAALSNRIQNRSGRD